MISLDILQVIPGSEKRRIDALVWAKGRLFSAGLQGEIIEYDVKKQAPKVSLDAHII